MITDALKPQKSQELLALWRELLPLLQETTPTTATPEDRKKMKDLLHKIQLLAHETPVPRELFAEAPQDALDMMFMGGLMALAFSL